MQQKFFQKQINSIKTSRLFFFSPSICISFRNKICLLFCRWTKKWFCEKQIPWSENALMNQTRIILSCFFIQNKKVTRIDISWKTVSKVEYFVIFQGHRIKLFFKTIRTCRHESIEEQTWCYLSSPLRIN